MESEASAVLQSTIGNGAASPAFNMDPFDGRCVVVSRGSNKSGSLREGVRVSIRSIQSTGSGLSGGSNGFGTDGQPQSEDICGVSEISGVARSGLSFSSAGNTQGGDEASLDTDSPTTKDDTDSTWVTWEKVLYKPTLNQFDDSFVPEAAFLDTLKVNENVKQYSFLFCVSWSGVIVERLSLISLFWLTWHRLHMRLVSSWWLICVAFCLMALGNVCRRGIFGILTQQPVSRVACAADMGKSMMLVSALWALAPVFKSLSESWAQESVVGIGVFLCIFHLVSHDYGFVHRRKTRIHEWLGRAAGDWSKLFDDEVRHPDNLSALNTGMFASIVLASRLSTSNDVFAFLLLAANLFAYVPFVEKFMYLRRKQIYYGVYFPALVSLSLVVLYRADRTAFLAYAILCFLATVVGPYLFVSALRFKREFKGPWDIAHVRRNQDKKSMGSTSIEGYPYIGMRGSASRSVSLADSPSPTLAAALARTYAHLESTGRISSPLKPNASPIKSNASPIKSNGSPLNPHGSPLKDVARDLQPELIAVSHEQTSHTEGGVFDVKLTLQELDGLDPLRTGHGAASSGSRPLSPANSLYKGSGPATGGPTSLLQRFRSITK